jgi:hypothetical protein
MGRDADVGRTAVEWFQDAVRWYVARHQGCPCCGDQHCLFRSAWGERVEYYCSACDFSAAHDRGSGSYYAVTGSPDGALRTDSAVLPMSLLSGGPADR